MNQDTDTTDVSVEHFQIIERPDYRKSLGVIDLWVLMEDVDWKTKVVMCPECKCQYEATDLRRISDLPMLYPKYCPNCGMLLRIDVKNDTRKGDD